MIMRRLLIRGGSIAAGIGASEPYALILAGELAANGVEVFNRSRAGDTSFEAVRTFFDDIAPLSPDILILHFGLDDMYHPVYRSEFKENMVQVVRLARERFAPDILLLTSQSFTDSSVMDAASIYYRAIREVAVDLGCEYLPVHLWWMSHLESKGENSATLYDYDERFPNTEGHRIIASAIAEKIREILNKSEKLQ
ncbi:MAG TPA: SGNH/GDSL hydrolase family protein [Spirochaetota bacterium]|nr:SGNH/GDSL hydrolase family protein [Spirochaetota bacterium]